MGSTCVEIKGGRDHSPVTFMAKETQFEKISLTYCQSNQSSIMRNTYKSLKTPSVFPQLNQSHVHSLLPMAAQGHREWGWWSVHHTITPCLCCSSPLRGRNLHILLLLQLPMGSQPQSGTSHCSAMGSSRGCRWISAPSWTPMGCRGTALHKLQGNLSFTA